MARYRIVGNRIVFGNRPGSIAELQITAGQAHALEQAGHIAPIYARRKPRKPSTATAPKEE